MKRIGNLYEQIYSLNNLILAENKARRGKLKQKDVIKFDLNKEQNLINLHKQLINNEFKNSKYHVFKIFEGKERVIYKLPYFPDRIIHHAILNILEPIFVSCFTFNTYSCIKNRGIHKALKDLTKSLKDVKNTQYCLKLDIQKFYPNIDNNILKQLLKKKFKDKQLLNLLFEIIDSTQGCPIGNYISQFFANFYLTYFDHYLKEQLKVKYYFRYCDDLVILHNDKQYLHNLKLQIEDYLNINLNLKIKSNYQVFPVNKRGIDFLGYKSYHTHILLRNTIKKNFIKMIKYNKNKKSIVAYNGWLKHGDCINLKTKYLTNE